MTKTPKLHLWKVIATCSVPVVACSIYVLWKRGRLFYDRENPSKPFTVQENIDDSEGNTVRTWTSLGLEQPVVIAMVGLPARGKSYLVKMLIRYLSWNGFECEVFNVGSYRRKIGLASADSSFFQQGNSDAQKVREDMAMAVQDSMYGWLHEVGPDGNKVRVGIFDGEKLFLSVILLYLMAFNLQQQILQSPEGWLWRKEHRRKMSFYYLLRFACKSIDA